jgi:hypothetical protein
MRPIRSAKLDINNQRDLARFDFCDASDVTHTIVVVRNEKMSLLNWFKPKRSEPKLPDKADDEEKGALNVMLYF